jgi:hypothetical protein
MQTIKCPQEIFLWIVKIIQTCNNDFHFDAVDALIELYEKRTQDSATTDELKLIRSNKWNEIHNILI